MQFDLAAVAVRAVDARTAGTAEVAEVAAAIVEHAQGVTIDRRSVALRQLDVLRGEDDEGRERRGVGFPAIEAVAEAAAERLAGDADADCPAHAAAEMYVVAILVDQARLHRVGVMCPSDPEPTTRR